MAGTANRFPAHLTPDAQNPTGLLASTAQRRRVLGDLAGVPVVADQSFADLVLDGPLGQPLARLRADEILPERREQLRRGRDALLEELATRLPFTIDGTADR